MLRRPKACLVSLLCAQPVGPMACGDGKSRGEGSSQFWLCVHCGILAKRLSGECKRLSGLKMGRITVFQLLPLSCPTHWLIHLLDKNQSSPLSGGLRISSLENHHHRWTSATSSQNRLRPQGQPHEGPQRRGQRGRAVGLG